VVGPRRPQVDVGASTDTLLFYVFDNLNQFLADPASLIFSRSGFSIYGGLFLGVLAGIVFLRRHSIPIRPMLDAVAPAMMIGYALGRVACQVVGDGDWGIASDLALKPGWLPHWLWAQSYQGNILGVEIEAPGVYPTPIYESAAGLVLFGVLWACRRHTHRAGFLFSLYVLLAGFERLLIEKIRINIEHSILGLSLTQAEIVSVLIIAAGLIGVLVTLQSRRRWTRIAFSVGVLGALSACVPL
jgi:phosphatidylglycerol:prolipoprotein diacylglycerol transferase